MATSEVENLRRDKPKATVFMTLDIVSLYALSMGVIVSMVSWKVIVINVSPFAQTFNRMRFGSMSTIMNGAIFIAALSVMAANLDKCHLRAYK